MHFYAADLCVRLPAEGEGQEGGGREASGPTRFTGVPIIQLDFCSEQSKSEISITVVALHVN